MTQKKEDDEYAYIVKVFDRMKNDADQVPSAALVEYFRTIGMQEDWITGAMEKIDVNHDNFLSWVEFGTKIKIINRLRFSADTETTPQRLRRSTREDVRLKKTSFSMPAKVKEETEQDKKIDNADKDKKSEEEKIDTKKEEVKEEVKEDVKQDKEEEGDKVDKDEKDKENKEGEKEVESGKEYGEREPGIPIFNKTKTETYDEKLATPTVLKREITVTKKIHSLDDDDEAEYEHEHESQLPILVAKKKLAVEREERDRTGVHKVGRPMVTRGESGLMSAPQFIFEVEAPVEIKVELSDKEEFTATPVDYTDTAYEILTGKDGNTSSEKDATNDTSIPSTASTEASTDPTKQDPHTILFKPNGDQSDKSVHSVHIDVNFPPASTPTTAHMSLDLTSTNSTLGDNKPAVFDLSSTPISTTNKDTEELENRKTEEEKEGEKEVKDNDEGKHEKEELNEERGTEGERESDGKEKRKNAEKDKETEKEEEKEIVETAKIEEVKEGEGEDKEGKGDGEGSVVGTGEDDKSEIEESDEEKWGKKHEEEVEEEEEEEREEEEREEEEEECVPMPLEFVATLLSKSPDSIISHGYTVIELPPEVLAKQKIYLEEFKTFVSTNTECCQTIGSEPRSPTTPHEIKRFSLRVCGKNSIVTTPTTARSGNIPRDIGEVGMELHELLDQICRKIVASCLKKTGIPETKLEIILDPINELGSTVQRDSLNPSVCYSSYVPDEYLSSSILEASHSDAHGQHRTDGGLLTIFLPSEVAGGEVYDQELNQWIAIEQLVNDYSRSASKPHNHFAIALWGRSSSYLKGPPGFSPCVYRMRAKENREGNEGQEEEAKVEKYSIAYKLRATPLTTPCQGQNDQMVLEAQLNAVQKLKLPLPPSLPPSLPPPSPSLPPSPSTSSAPSSSIPPSPSTPSPPRSSGIASYWLGVVFIAGAIIGGFAAKRFN